MMPSIKHQVLDLEDIIRDCKNNEIDMKCQFASAHSVLFIIFFALPLLFFLFASLYIGVVKG